MSDPKQICFFDRMIKKQSLDWYWAHFDPPAGQAAHPVRGEITPFYARLSKRSVDSVLSLLPEIRVLLTIRNPVDRCWSAAHLDLGHYGGRQLAMMSPSAFFRYFERQRVTRYTDYDRIIDLWSSGSTSDRLHVECFEEIEQDPVGLLSRSLLHIGASSEWVVPFEQLTHIVRPEGDDHQGVLMPESVRWYLSSKWIEPTRRLNHRLGGAVQGWVDSMEEVLGDPVASWRLRGALTRCFEKVPEAASFWIYDQLNEWSIKRAWNRLGL
jgi:hypothetical protein